MPYKAECYKGSEIISQGSTQGLVLKTVFFLECAGFEQPRSVEGTHSWPEIQFSSVTQSCPILCNPMDCSTPGSLSFTDSQNLLKLMSIESMMPSNHLLLCRPLLLLPSIFPSIRVFSMSQFFASGGPGIGVSASASVFPMNIQV